MSIKKTRWLVLSLLIIMLLAGCRCDNSMIPTFIGILDSPADGELVSSLSPTFNWHGNASCDPDEYIFHIDEDDLSYSPVASQNISPTNLPYTYTGGNLLPARSYTWRVAAVNGAQDDSPHVYGPDTEMGQFFTGPVCSGETLIAPELDYPGQTNYSGEFDDWINHGHDQKFKWTYTSDCLPLHYDYQFANDQAFTDIVLDGTTTDPYVQYTYASFPNCSTMFWRVRANDGMSVGPWSDAWQFHWVTDETCWQNHYLSEDFAWIKVSVLRDRCDQTGVFSAWTATLNPGCMADGMFIVGDGTSADYTLDDVVVDLGSGPCPSTGLDQKMAEYNDPFGVITPGTYCVTVSRNQTADLYGPINMMDGIWTNPRVNQILAEETVTFGPGVGDHYVRLFWDEIDRPMLLYPIEFTYACKFGPEDICNTYDFAEKGEFIPLLGRATNSDWKLTQLNGFPCYIRLGNAAINEKLAKYEGFELRAEDLEIFPQPDPCPPAPRQIPVQNPKTCSDYATRAECGAHVADGCIWSGASNSCGGP